LFSGKIPFTLFATIGNPVYFPVEITIKTETETLRMLPDCLFIDQKVVEFEKDERVFVKKDYGTGHERLFMDFYDCIDTGRSFPLNGSEGVKAIRLMNGVYQSKGQKISLR